MIEGRAAGTDLFLRGYLDNSQQPLLEGKLDINVSSVEDMYNQVSLRGAESNTNFVANVQQMPTNLCDNVKDVDVFFLHGFNVSESDSHAWGAEVFKRLWQSGARIRFWSLTWSGDYNWLGSVFNGLHYQQDVYQALKTGAALKSFVERVQTNATKRTLMAHSLGNMVACEALNQGLSVGKYFMFNAAVASEAFDGSFQNANSTVKAKYVPSDWSDYHPMSWASNWFRWFDAEETDFRYKMGWPDYFVSALGNAGVIYNYYSSGDPVFGESDTVPGVASGVFHWPTLSLSWPFVNLEVTAEAGSWQKQETRKGVDPVIGTLSGGWGFYCWPEIIGNESVTVKYTASQANAMVPNGTITNNPVFNCSGTPMNDSNATLDQVWLSLAKYVPAISSPIGGNAIFAVSDRDIDLNLDSEGQGVPRLNGWGRNSGIYGQSWLHSDMKDMAFFYIHALYDDLSEKGNLK